MADLIFPIDFDEKCTMAQGDYILFSDSEDGDKIKKAQYCNLKGETGNAATIEVGCVSTGCPGTSVCICNSGDCNNAIFDFTIPQGDKGDTGDEGASICCADFDGNNIVFGKDNGCCVVLADAKTCLQGPQGCKGDTGETGNGICCATLNPDYTLTLQYTNGCSDTTGSIRGPQGEQGPQGCTGCTGATGNGICCTELNPDYTLTIHYDNGCCDTTGSIRGPQGEQGCEGPQGCQGPIGCTGPAGNGICCTTLNPDYTLTFQYTNGCCDTTASVQGPQGCTGEEGPAGVGICCSTCTKVGKTTTVELQYTNGTCFDFSVSDGEDGQGSGDMIKCVYDPNGCESNAFNMDNMEQGTTNKFVSVGDINNWNGKAGVIGFPNGTTKAQINTTLSGLDDLQQVLFSTANATVTRAWLGNTAPNAAIKGIITKYTSTESVHILAHTYNGDVFTAAYKYSNGTLLSSIEYKQTQLTTTQLNAVNSGITSEKVGIYDGYATSKQDKIDDLDTIRAGATCGASAAQPSDIPTDNCQLCNGCGYTTCTGTLSSCSDIISELGYTPYNSTNPNGYTTCTGDATDSCVVHLDGAETITGEKTIKSVVKIQNGQGTGSLWIGGNVNSNTVSNNNRHLARISVPSYSDITVGATLLGFDTSGDSDLHVTNKTYDVVSFGGMKKITNATSPLAIGFTVATERGATVCTKKVNPLEMDANEVRFNVQPNYNGNNLATVCDIPTNNCQLANGCGYTTCTGTLSSCTDIITSLGYTPYNSTNPNGYTTCTGTLSSCSDIINALGYTPYNSTNPNGYTTCTGTLSSCSDIISALGYTPTSCTGDIQYSSFNINTATSGATLTINNLTTQFTPSEDFSIVAGTVKEGMQYIVRINSGATAYTMSLGTGVTNPFGEDLTLTASKMTTVVMLATSSSTLEIFSILTAE